MPPGPSDPASIPITRKSSRAGMPNRCDALLARMQISRRLLAPNRRYSMEATSVLPFHLCHALRSQRRGQASPEVSYRKKRPPFEKYVEGWSLHTAKVFG